MSADPLERSGRERGSPSGEFFEWPPADDAVSRLTVVELKESEIPEFPSEPEPATHDEPVPRSGEPVGLLLDRPEPGFDVYKFQRAQAAVSPPTETTGSGRGKHHDEVRPPGAHRHKKPSPISLVVISAVASLAAPMRRLRLTPVQCALVAAIALVIAQAVYIATRLSRPPAPATPVAAVQDPSPTPPVERRTSPAGSDQVLSAPVSTLGSTGSAPKSRDATVSPRTPLPVRLVVRSNPPGASVTVDGRSRGVTPLTLQGLAPGAHKVVVHGPGGDVEHAVDAEPGTTATVLASLAPRTAAGWIAVTAPMVLEVYEGEELLGTSATSRLLLTTGRHTLSLVNEELGYRSQQTVEVTAGEVSRVAPEIPMGTLHLNALPWAEVSVDGRKVGETPLGNLQVPIGPHEIVFRHPELGEISRTAVVSLRGPTRVSVTLGRDRN